MRQLAEGIYNPVLPASLGGKGADAQKGGTALGSLISNFISALFIAGFLLAFVMLILGAFHWISSGGDKQELEKARNQITNAIVGLLVVAASYAVMVLVGKFFGIELTNIKIPSFSANNP